MTTRMQQRRGTSTQWTAADPILANGEIGVETDTNQFKLGDGVNVWSDLSYFKNLDDLAGSLDDYVLLSTKGQPSGVAELDSDGHVPLSQLANLVASAPQALDTLNELASALGNDANFSTTILAAVGTKVSSSTFTTHTDATTSVHGIANTALLATTANVATAKSEAITDASAAAATDATAKVATAKSEAIAAAASDATTKVATAKSEAIAAAASAAGTALTTHNSATTNVHGISDTSALALTTTVNSALALKAPLDSPTFTGTVSGVTKAHVGLGSVDNTADADKPVSSATSTALGLKAPLASPTFTGAVTIPAGASISGFAPLASPALTGTPTAPTAAAGTSTTQVATTAFVGTAVANLVASAPAALDTLNELATALGNDAAFSTTITNSIALKAPLASPTFTGTVTVSSSGVAFTDGTQTKEGVASRTAIVQKTAAYTLSALTERDSLIEVSSATGVTITIPTNTAVAYPIGTSIDILQTGAGQVTIAPVDGTVTVNATPGLKLRTTWSSATLFKRAANTWVVFGDLTA
jgi:hypothetical protein